MAVVNEILNNVFNLTGTNNALPTFPKKKKQVVVLFKQDNQLQ
jgi:hypothetical protein